MNLVGTLGYSEYSRSFNENIIEEAIKNEFKTDFDGKNKSVIYEALFTDKKADKFNYQIGLRSGYNYNRTISKYSSIQEEDNSRFDLYPYLSVNGKLGNLAYMIGTGMKYLRNENTYISKEYIKNTSNVSFFYQTNKGINLQYIFLYAPSYPQISSLSNIEQSIDENIRMTGNPYINPFGTIRNTFNITYRPKNHISSVLSLSHSYLDRPIRDIISDEHDYFLIKPQNINNEYSFGAKLETSISSIITNFDFKIGLGWNSYHSKIKNIAHKLDDFYWSAVINYYNKNFAASFGWKEPEKILAGEQIYQGENNSYINAMYNYKRLAFAVGVYFPFTRWSQYYSWRVSPMALTDRKVYIKDNSYMFFVGVSYNFNWGKSLFNLSRNRNNTSTDNSFIKVNDN
ncbi:MAG: outer membrane beta-barrel family protein [Tannerellaceae bacterium]|jgi:hypothetical protein|nr:outer membrane beta-barrel family protein [Tannerellaceae bacterium]